MEFEEKIYYKAKTILDTFDGRSSSSANKKQRLIDLVGAMKKIMQAEVNIRLQEAKHHPLP